MKRISKVALLASALWFGAVNVQAASFTDIQNLHKDTQSEIHKAVEIGYFKDGQSFNPTQQLKRSHATLTIARAIAGGSSIEHLRQYVDLHHLMANKTPFVDVPISFRAGTASQQELFYASLIVKDIGAFTNPYLNPNGVLTRKQMAKVLVESFDLEAGNETIILHDVQDAETKHYTQILASLEITKPVNGYFKPGNPVNRAQMASFLVRTYHTMQPVGEIPNVGIE